MRSRSGCRMRPERIPLFDLVLNDAILQYFNEGKPVACGDDRGAVARLRLRLMERVPRLSSPAAPRVERLPDGREARCERWTTWYSELSFTSTAEYACHKRRQLEKMRQQLDDGLDLAADAYYQRQRELHRWFFEPNHGRFVGSGHRCAEPRRGHGGHACRRIAPPLPEADFCRRHRRQPIAAVWRSAGSSGCGRQDH